MIDELLIVRDAWKDSFQRDRISGFVQSVGHFPFFVTFYIEEQADMYIRDCSQTEFPTWNTFLYIHKKSVDHYSKPSAVVTGANELQVASVCSSHGFLVCNDLFHIVCIQ